MCFCDCYKFSLCCDNLNYCSHFATLYITYTYITKINTHLFKNFREVGFPNGLNLKNYINKQIILKFIYFVGAG